jgi:mRNA interferase HigB
MSSYHESKSKSLFRTDSFGGLKVSKKRTVSRLNFACENFRACRWNASSMQEQIDSDAAASVLNERYCLVRGRLQFRACSQSGKLVWYDMRLISIRPLREFWTRHVEAEQPLRTWIKVVEKARWSKPDDVVVSYPYADPMGNSRVVFNIKGNKYRLMVHIVYEIRVVYVRFIGTHAEYDRINVETV